MVPNPLDPEPIFPKEDDEESTICGATFTPPQTVVADLDDHDWSSNASPFLVPWPGSLCIIRSVSSGQAITLLEGNVLLTEPGGHGSTHWACIENKGWLGFRNVVSGKFLGHDKKGRLCCLAGEHQKREFFCIRPRPGGGCLLLMTHWESLSPVGMRIEQGERKLAKVEDGGSDGMFWEFVRM